MNKSVFLAGAAITALATAGIALGFCIAVSFAPSPISIAEASPPPISYFEVLLGKVEGAGNDAGAKAACGVSTAGEADPFETLVKADYQSGRISDDEFAKLDLAYLGAEYRAKSSPCRLNGASEAG